jgi:hypothetical protein
MKKNKIMNFLKDVLNGFKIGASYIEENYGNGFYHLCAISTFTVLIILLPSMSLEMKLRLLFITLITTWLGVKFANYLKK